ncbi:MAG: alkaline phosphatase family protein [Halopseudomonas sp.]
MLTPDYDCSIVNLISAVAGAHAPAADLYPPLSVLDDARCEQRPVALLVIDGLGYQFLQRFPASALARHCVQRLTSVFPTTTAAAVTALALGVPAQQHGISGWFTYLRELGAVVMPLPFMPRGGGSVYSDLGISADSMLDARPLLPRLNRRVQVSGPGYIADSDFSRALYGNAPKAPHNSLAQLFDQLTKGLKHRGHPLVWGYWTELDGLAHQYGSGSAEVSAHFHQIDRLFEQWLEQLAGSDALVLVTADHGLIDVVDEQRLLLEHHPELEAMLRLPLCGEPRAAFCYLRPGCQRDFEQYFAEHFADLFEVVASEQLLEQRLFGRGSPSSRLPDRIGDMTVLAKQQAIINDRLLQERPFLQRGVHGGLSAEELYVPLVMAEP